MVREIAPKLAANLGKDAQRIGAQDPPYLRIVIAALDEPPRDTRPIAAVLVSNQSLGHIDTVLIAKSHEPVLGGEDRTHAFLRGLQRPVGPDGDVLPSDKSCHMVNVIEHPF